MDNDKPRKVMEAERLGVFTLFIAAIGWSGTTDWVTVSGGFFVAMLAYGFATGLALVWGERTRPKNKLIWWLMALALAAWLMSATLDSPVRGGLAELAVLHFPLAFAVALASRHDLGTTPTLMIGAVALLAARPSRWAFLEPGETPLDSDATWIALAVLLAIAAATFEHERLMRQRGAGTPGAWTTIRLGFVTLWTIAILALREDIQWGRAFTWLGADLRGQSGQMLLIGILLAALVLAAFAFQPQKDKAKR